MSDLKKLTMLYDSFSNKDTPFARATQNIIQQLTPKLRKSATMTNRAKSPSKRGGKKKEKT